MMNVRALLESLKEKTGIKTDKELAKELNVSYNTLTKWLARNSLKYEPIILFLLKEGIDFNEIFGGDDVQIISGGFHGGQNAQNVGGNQSQSTLATKYEIDEVLLKLIQNAVVMVEADEEKINQLKALIKKWTMEQI